MNNDLKKISVLEIFTKTNYLIPIYQRNYAWKETQIVQLIEDIDSSIDKTDKNYFLGNLIVNQKDNNIFEVIDGQQRLTTLYLLEKYLDILFPKEALQFEARNKSNRTLSYIKNSNNSELIEDFSSPEILNGFRIIENYFKNKNIKNDKFTQKLNQVFLIQVQVPQKIDLNHYFEIMNTRGEQLKLHEIAKAKLLKVLNNDDYRKTAAMIWENCSNMDSYIQMNFNSKIRNIIFSEDWSSLNESITNFDCINTLIQRQNKNQNIQESTEKKSLEKILNDNIINDYSTVKEEEDNERFESSISFPNFLLQVNAVIKKNIEDDDSSLDDKNFLNNLSWAWSDINNSKDFLFKLLKCRVLFDKYVLKREFAKEYKEKGQWSLQRLEKYSDKRNNKPKYVNTFDIIYNKKLKTLQSCLRITYTSPKTMHWITIILFELINNENTDIITLLENYCNNKVVNSNYQNKNGFEIERIVFTYLDYLIYRDGYLCEDGTKISPLMDNWHFIFRNSIEHFYPQHPVEGDKWGDKDLNGFGNLALITVSGNSRFSNLLPWGKNSFDKIIKQSLKLMIMNSLTKTGEGKWTEEKARKHQEDMFEILRKSEKTINIFLK